MQWKKLYTLFIKCPTFTIYISEKSCRPPCLDHVSGSGYGTWQTSYKWKDDRFRFNFAMSALSVSINQTSRTLLLFMKLKSYWSEDKYCQDNTHNPIQTGKNCTYSNLTTKSRNSRFLLEFLANLPTLCYILNLVESKYCFYKCLL